MQYSYCQCSSIQISSDRGQLASHKNSFCCCVYRWNYAVKKLVLTTPKLYCKSKTAVGMLLHYRSTSNELCHPFLKVIVCCGFVRTCIRAHVCVLKVVVTHSCSDFRPSRSQVPGRSIRDLGSGIDRSRISEKLTVGTELWQLASSLHVGS